MYVCTYVCICTYTYRCIQTHYIYVCVCIYVSLSLSIYIYISTREAWAALQRARRQKGGALSPLLGRGDDTVGNPHRIQIYQFELFELVLLLLKLDKQFPVEQFEASRAIRGSSYLSQRYTPPLLCVSVTRLYYIYIYIYVYVYIYIYI